MIHTRLRRPLPNSWPSSIFFIRSHRPQYWTMSDYRAVAEQKKPSPVSTRPKKEKRPPLTHFLCLPLVNSTSLPQLESSIATFKAAVRRLSQPEQDDSKEPQPLIPDGAVRPVGTLHLTLGVMSLPTEERLNKAINFLNSLDLNSMVLEAETTAKKRAERRRGQSPTGVASPTDAGATLASKSVENSQGQKMIPFTISLESLHALPRARSATVLHAAPVDPTSRLYPFCEMLRDRFLEAGFLQGEMKKGNKEKNLNDTGLTEEKPSLMEEPPVAEQAEGASSNPTTAKPPVAPRALSSRPKPRPLLLHATVVNTIYIRGRGRHDGRQKGKSRRNSQYIFDARDILSHYRDYYVDSDRKIPRTTWIEGAASKTTASSDNEVGRGKNVNNEGADQSNISRPNKARKMSPDPITTHGPQNPFVWAKEFPLDTLCVCEMGAKKLGSGKDKSEWDSRLGEKYTVVAERRLDFSTPPPCL